jgi:N-acetylmuramoyl-L-alanine amidase
MARIVIDPGHGGAKNIPNDSTANNAVGPKGTLEKALTLDIGLRLRDLLKQAGHDVRLTRETDVNLRLRDRAKVAKDFKADAFVSIHFNGSTNHQAQGTETLVHLNFSPSSARLSLAVQDALLKVTKLTDRNKAFDGKTRIKPQSLGVLRPDFHHPSTAGCLAEISFLDRADQEQLLQEKGHLQSIAKALASGIEAFTGKAVAPIVPEAVDISAVALVHRNLDKFEFLRRNDAAIGTLLDRVGELLIERYGTDAVPVTREDVWVITNCEGGITSSGKINPRFVHSEGEVGLYPLPSNIQFWNGKNAPPFNRETPIETNAFHYYLYLGHLKNRSLKTVGTHRLYRDLFRSTARGNAAVRNAKILAGVVHGYFFSGAYRDRKVPLQHLLDGYARDVNIGDLMRATTFKHGQTNIVANRARNIDAALTDLKAFLA